MNSLLGATALAGTLVMAPAAWAQTAETPSSASTQDPSPANEAADPDADPEVQEQQASGDVVVTGSRLARPNIDTTIPITTLSAAQINSVGQVSLGETLNRLPALRPTLNQQNSTNGIGTAGINALDLRGLGTTRTLTLVNGRRHVTSQPGVFTVDVNTIPNQLVERIETVTGGNTGIYGSDAVAGVVNFILKQDYDGIDARVQGGASDRGDRGTAIASVVGGKNFGDGRGNITFAAEYAYQEQLLFQDRNGQTGAITGVPGFFQTQQTTFLNPPGTTPASRNEPPEGDGIPDTSFFGVQNGNRFGIISLGGTVNTICQAANGTAARTAQRAAVCTGALSPIGGELARNYVFLPDGTLVRDNPTLDLRNVGGGIFGGQTATGIEGAMLLPGLDRINLNLLGHYDISDAFRPFFEAKYVKVTANQTSTQPTFVNGNLLPTFRLDNPFLTAQARSTIQTITGQPGSTNGAFSFFRFNNDIGTRAEDHERETYRFVGGVRGDLLDEGNWRYEASFNYGRTETYYETGGNVLIREFNQAADAVRNAAGQIVCRINADASTTNDDPACRPLNLFGQGAPSTTPEGLDYVLYTSSREQWAEQINALFFVSGDSSGFFNLPGGAIQLSLGAEYRREDAYSDYDDPTQNGLTFLNGFATFDPPAVDVVESFGEIRIPILDDLPFVNELAVEASGRVSKYSFLNEPVYGWNVGAVYSPVSDLRIRGSYARSVRAPTLENLSAAQAQTFANNFVDPCSQTVINQEPNRARNCAAAGIPTTITLPNGEVRPWTNVPGSGISGFNQGNPNLEPEKGRSWTIGGVFQPRFLPGFSLTVDYFNIEVREAIAGLTGQAIVNRCYEDPVSIDNPFCAAVFRRRSSDPVADFTFAGQQNRRFDGLGDLPIGGVIGPGFLNQPFNFQKLETSGVDADASYSHTFTPDIKLNLRAVVSYLEKRNQFTFIADPTRYVRLKSTQLDPTWRGLFTGFLQAGPIDIAYNAQYIGRVTVAAAYETQGSVQGRPPTNADAFPERYTPDIILHDIQVGVKVNDLFRAFVGVDNIRDTLPPYAFTGTTNGSLYPVTGRFLYAGANFKF